MATHGGLSLATLNAVDHAFKLISKSIFRLLSSEFRGHQLNCNSVLLGQTSISF